MSSDDFPKIWNLLAVSYPNYGRDLDASTLAETVRLYQRLLADLPVEAVKQAALRHISTSKWFPTVAELREAASQIANPTSQEQTALEAWGDVMDTFASGECYAGEYLMRVPRFHNPLTQAAVTALGGWANLTRSDNQVADRARFVEVYGQLQARQRSERQLPLFLRAAGSAPQLPAPTGSGRGWTVVRDEPQRPALLASMKSIGQLLAHRSDTCANVASPSR